MAKTAKTGRTGKEGKVRERIAARIREAIVSGTFVPGSCLPPVRELARQHGASLVSAVQAIELLAEKGYLDRRQRQGVYVNPREAWQVRSKHVAIATGVPSNYASRTLRGSSHLFGMQQVETLLERAGWRISFHGCVSYPFGDGIRRAWIPPQEQPGLAHADALIAADIYETSYLASLRDLGLPVVVYDLDASDLRCDSVCVDDVGSGFALTSLLIEAGHREIAFLGTGLNLPDRQRRWNYDPCLLRRADGYRLAMRTHGLAEHLFFATASGQKPHEAMVAAARKELPGCRAFVVNGLAGGAYAALRGTAVARWAAGAGEPLGGDEIVAGIDFARMGVECVRLLEARLADRAAPVRRTQIWPQFTVRRRGAVVPEAAARWNRGGSPIATEVTP